MLSQIETLPRRVRRLWLAEVLVVAAILAWAVVSVSAWLLRRKLRITSRSVQAERSERAQ